MSLDKNKIKFELFSILQNYKGIDKEVLSIFSNIKRMFYNSTNEYLNKYNELKSLEDKITQLNDQIQQGNDLAFDEVREYVYYLKLSIVQLSFIQYNLFKKSKGEKYSLKTYNKDIKIYYDYKRLFSRQGDKVNKFFN